MIPRCVDMNLLVAVADTAAAMWRERSPGPGQTLFQIDLRCPDGGDPESATHRQKDNALSEDVGGATTYDERW